MNSKFILFLLLSFAPFVSYTQPKDSEYYHTCGLYTTSKDFLNDNLINKSDGDYNESPLTNRLKVSGVKIKLGEDNPYWGGMIMGKQCRFASKYICHILLTGPLCIYTISDIPEFSLQVDSGKITSYGYCSNATLLVSKGLDGEMKKVWSDKDMEAFLADDPKLLAKYMNDDTKYKGGPIVTRWMRFLNCVVKYNKIHAKKG